MGSSLDPSASAASRHRYATKPCGLVSPFQMASHNSEKAGEQEQQMRSEPAEELDWPCFVLDSSEFLRNLGLMLAA